MQQPPAYPDFHALKYVLAKPETSLNLKILPAIFTVAQGTQATPAESSSLKIVSPGWRPSWMWYLAEVPALSAVACNSVPALTLLRGSTPPEKNRFEPLRRREWLYNSLGMEQSKTFPRISYVSFKVNNG